MNNIKIQKKYIYSVLILLMSSGIYAQRELPLDTCAVPTLFTPNDDGQNEFLEIPCLNKTGENVSEITIFNEWGEKLFYAKPYQNDFDGTYRGIKLPEGTYFYIFRKDAKMPIQKGYFTLFR